MFGLGVSALLKNDIHPAHNLKVVTICPGFNLAYFSGIFSLKRPNMFVNELILYVDYYKKQINVQVETLSASQMRSLKSFYTNLLSGIEYYRNLVAAFKNETAQYIEEMKSELNEIEETILSLNLPFEVVVKS